MCGFALLPDFPGLKTFEKTILVVIQQFGLALANPLRK